MSKFFVGQRVRIVGRDWHGPADLHPAGKEGRIVGKGRGSPRTGIAYEWELDVPGYSWFLADSDDLEPVLPEGHQPSEFTTLHDLLASLEVTA